MTRQSKTWLVIGAVFVALIVARGMIGQGLGRVYVKRSDVTVKLPDAVAEKFEAGGTSSASNSAASTQTTASLGSAASSSSAALTQATTQSSASNSSSSATTMSWQEWKQVPPMEFIAAQ